MGGVKGLESIPAHKTFMRRTITGLAGVSSPGELEAGSRAEWSSAHGKLHFVYSLARNPATRAQALPPPVPLLQPLLHKLFDASQRSTQRSALHHPSIPPTAM